MYEHIEGQKKPKQQHSKEPRHVIMPHPVCPYTLATLYC